MDAVQRRGSAARMNYIKRFLSVLVAFVLCLGLIQPPRAKAVVPAVVLAYGTGVAISAVASVLGSFIAAYVGLRIENPMVRVGDGYVMGTGGYDFGSLIWPAVVTAGSAAVKKWWTDTIAFFEGKGGFAPGDEITIPADVAEFARNWIAQKYDFSAGAITVNQNGIFSEDGTFVLFSNPCVTGSFASEVPDPIAPSYLGTRFAVGDSFTMDGKTYKWVCDTNYATRFTGWVRLNSDGTSTKMMYHAGVESDSNTMFGVVGIYGGTLRLGFWWKTFGGDLRWSNAVNSVSLDSLEYSLSSSVAATDALNTPVTKDMTVAIPKDVAMGKVGVWDIPATTELTKEGILVGQGEVVEPTAAPQPTAIPGEGTMVGDIAIEGIQTAAQDKGLGALFISKFPFCIPWDFVNAVKLLAAPPKTPYWEVDFLAPIAGRYGGALGDTTIYIDFSDYELLGQLSRWITTFLFVTLLMMGTKRLIWTA